MGQSTKIEWTDVTWNPIIGCRRKSAGCERCYAERMAHRLGSNPLTPQYAGLTQNGRWSGIWRLVPEALEEPLRWRKPRRVFVCSMGDLFGEGVEDAWIDRVWAMMAITPQHTYQVLTKRPERMAEWLAKPYWEDDVWSLCEDLAESYHERQMERGVNYGGDFENCGDTAYDAMTRMMAYTEHGRCLPNVWIGTSVENSDALPRVGAVRAASAAVRFLSLEPLLGPLPGLDLTGIDWCIVGGESGPGARPCSVVWIRDIVCQCQTAGVPVFVKQLGSQPRSLPTDCGDGSGMRLRDRKGGNMNEWPEHLRVREFPIGAAQ